MGHYNNHIPTRLRQNGVSLLEVLVAILVISLGLLGLGGLQATGLRKNYGSYIRAQAAQYAFDMTDRIRANLVNANSYALAINDGKPTGDTLHNKDRREWLEQLETLPAGDGRISLTSTTINGSPVLQVTVTVEWDDRRAAAYKDEALPDETPDNANTNARLVVTTRL